MNRNSIIASCALMLVPLSATANDLLIRLENATEQLSKNEANFYLSKVPELADKLPAWEWDEEIRSASQCLLKGIEMAKGKAVAESYVAGIEQAAKNPVTSVADLSSAAALPAELQGDDQTLPNLMQSCGTLEISAVRLKDSGFWDAMMNPEIRNKLMTD